MHAPLLVMGAAFMRPLGSWQIAVGGTPAFRIRQVIRDCIRIVAKHAKVCRGSIAQEEYAGQVCAKTKGPQADIGYALGNDNFCETKAFKEGYFADGIEVFG